MDSQSRENNILYKSISFGEDVSEGVERIKNLSLKETSISYTEFDIYKYSNTLKSPLYILESNSSGDTTHLLDNISERHIPHTKIHAEKIKPASGEDISASSSGDILYRSNSFGEDISEGVRRKDILVIQLQHYNTDIQNVLLPITENMIAVIDKKTNIPLPLLSQINMYICILNEKDLNSGYLETLAAYLYKYIIPLKHKYVIIDTLRLCIQLKSHLVIDVYSKLNLQYNNFLYMKW